VSGGQLFNVLSSTLQLDGNLTTIGSFQLGDTALLTGTGTVMLHGGVVGAHSGGITIDSGITASGFGGSLGRPDQPLVNRGHIVANGGQSYGSLYAVSGAPIMNSGVIEAPTARTVAFNGTFSRAGLGNLIAGPTSKFMVSGTLLNQGQTLTVDANNPWMLAGTVQGGTIEVAAGQSLSTYWHWGATLDDVWLNGRYAFGGELAPLEIKNGILQGNAEIVLDPASLDGASSVVSGGGSLVISSGATVRGGGGYTPVVNFASGIGKTNNNVPLTNHGTILADFPESSWTGEFRIYSSLTTNDGKLGVKERSLLNVFGDVTFLSGGVLQVEMGPTANRGMLLVNGQLHLGSAGDLLSLTSGPTVQPFTFYRIASATGGITGVFDSVTPGFEVMYTGNDILARVVPEPVLSFIFPMLLVHRRRRT
jgi:hypothetical protein